MCGCCIYACVLYTIHTCVCVTLTGSDQGEEGGKGKAGVSGNATRKKEGEGGGNGSTEGDTSNSPFATLSDEGRRLQCECRPLHVWVSMRMSFLKVRKETHSKANLEYLSCIYLAFDPQCILAQCTLWWCGFVFLSPSPPLPLSPSLIHLQPC